jgi:hypothetical protein
MEILRSYVVRVYRHESVGVTGVIESVETGETAPFQSADELWANLLRALPSRRYESLDFPDRTDGSGN